MSKYIDVDVFIKSFREALPWLKAQVDPDLTPKAYDYLRGGEAIIEDLTKFPAADVVEIRHGKWIQPHWKNSNYCCNCSECGGEAMHADYQWDKNGIYPICPNCGAKMDKEDAWKDDALGQKED